MTTQIIPLSSFLAAGASLFLCVALPAILLAVLLLRRKISIRPVLVGAGVFIVFQLILRLSIFLPLISSIPFLRDVLGTLWSYSLFLGLTAGLFEELGRVAGYQLLLRQNRFWWDGFAFGLGHGGIEAISLTGMTCINNLVLMNAINSGSFSQLASALDAETARTIYDSLTQAAPVDFLLGGVERVFAMTIQIALSILVLYALQSRRPWMVVLAIALHALIDSPLGILPSFGWSIYAIEGYIAVCAVAAAGYIVFSYKQFAGMPMPIRDDPPPHM